MNTYQILEDARLFGLCVEKFPQGIETAFTTLASTLPEGLQRSYYGISWMKADKVIYYAMAMESFEGEAQKSGLEILILEKGNYLSVPILQWKMKTACINDVFRKMMENKDLEPGKPCVEWYKNQEEMYCLLKLKDR